MVLIFLEDKTVLIHIPVGNAETIGECLLEKTDNVFAEGEHSSRPSVNRRKIRFIDVVGDHVEWVWENFYINRSGISCDEWRTGGYYAYKLVRNR